MKRFLILLLVLFPVQMVLSKTTIVNYREGPYADIRVDEDGVKMSKTFNMGRIPEVNAAKKKILKDPGSFSPFLLMIMGERMVRDGDFDEGLFWFHAGRLMARYDALRCTDKSAGSSISSMNMMLSPTFKEQFRDMDKLEKTIDRAEEFARTTKFTYDPRYMALHGIVYYSVALGGKEAPQSLLVPEKEWPELFEKAVQNYREGIVSMKKKIADMGGTEEFYRKVEEKK